MAKVKTRYICQNCGANSPKWMGKCTNCNEWESYVEEIVQPSSKANTKQQQLTGMLTPTTTAVSISRIESIEEKRLITNDEELNRVLGGGIVPGSLVLLGGDPGIGKSTLLLQTANQLARDTPILYVCAEESGQQVKLRSLRLGIGEENDQKESGIKKTFIYCRKQT